MGLTESKPQQINNPRHVKMSKDELLRNVKVLIDATKNNNANNTYTDGTLNWLTSSSGLSDLMKGGFNTTDVRSDSENNTIDRFIQNIDTDTTTDNFDIYQEDMKKIENYIMQNGGYDKFEGRPVNISHSKYLDLIQQKLQQNNNNNTTESDNTDSTMDILTTDNNTDELSRLDNYIKQNGGYDKFEGRLLNIINSKILNNMNTNEINNNENDTDGSVSSINLETEKNNNLFMKNNKFIGGSFSATSTVQYGQQLGGTLSTTSNNLSSVNNKNLMKGGNDDSSSSSSSNFKFDNDDDTQSTDNTIKIIKKKSTVKQTETSDSSNDETEKSSSSSSSSSSLSNSLSSSSSSSSSSNELETTDNKRQSSNVSSIDESVDSTTIDDKKINIISENSINEHTQTQTQSSEFRAVPFYSSDNSTDFYRKYQTRNRFS